MKSIPLIFCLIFVSACGEEAPTQPHCEGNEAHSSTGISFCENDQFCVSTESDAFCALQSTPSSLCEGDREFCENETTVTRCNEEGYLVSRLNCRDNSPGGFCDGRNRQVVFCGVEERILIIRVSEEGRVVFNATNYPFDFDVNGGGGRSQTVQLGTQFNVRTTPSSGYELESWGQAFCDDESSSCSFTVEGDMEFNIVFTEI